MTVIYLYLVVWGVTDWAFSVWASNCTYSGDLCHFSPFLAQLSPPANIIVIYSLGDGFSCLCWSLSPLKRHKVIIITSLLMLGFGRVGFLLSNSIKRRVFIAAGFLTFLSFFYERLKMLWNPMRYLRAGAPATNIHIMSWLAGGSGRDKGMKSGGK